MEWLAAILGIVSLVGSVVTAVQSNKKAKETDEYNKNLNQTIFDREDNAWQRAVEDRSKSGLSVAGLSQGAGAGGSVSQLQSQQSTAFQNLSNVLQNGAGTMFGLANSAYDRKLQKQIATDELQLKKQQLKHEKLTSRLQYMMDLAQIQLAAGKTSDEHKIFAHNMKIATGEYTDPKYRVYGSEPSEIERILTGLINNKDKILESDIAQNVKENVSNFVNNDLKGKERADNNVPIRDLVGEFTAEKIPQDFGYLNISKSADGKEYYLHIKNNKTVETKRISLSKAQYEKIYAYLKEKGMKK